MEDLSAARLCLEADPPLLYPAAFHAQQAGEKALKAWLIALGEDEPLLTHSLNRIAEAIDGRGGPTLPDGPLRFLTTFAVDPRYGDVEVTANDATRAVTDAERVVDQAMEAIRALQAHSGDAGQDST